MEHHSRKDVTARIEPWLTVDVGTTLNREDVNLNSKTNSGRWEKIKRLYYVGWNHVSDYCQNTSMHGFKYIGEHGRPFLERMCWLLAVSLSFALCAYMIQKVWQKWDASPVIVSFSETSTPIWEVPFPAVTICPENKVKQTLFNLTLIQNKENRTEGEQEAFNQLMLLCDLPVYDKLEHWATTDPQAVNFTFNNYIEEYQNRSNVLLYRTLGHLTQVEWSKKIPQCACKMVQFGEKYLRGPNSTGWTPETGYPKEDIKNSYPKRARKPGSKSGINIYLKMDWDDMDFACRWPVQGFKVLIHNPAEYPNVGNQFFRVPLKRDVVAVVDSTIMKTSEEVQKYPISTRRCFFPHERKLLYFKIYSQRNCEVECMANLTQEYCDCLPFYWPNCGTIKVCEADNVCFLFGENFVDSNFIMEECKCYPACTEIRYSVETSQSQLIWPYVQKFGPAKNDSNTTHFGRLSIYFKNMQFMSSRRSELYGVTDFMANCGGLLGLCCGFSLLSAVEIIYFFSVRLGGNAWRRRKSEKST